jgi:hypothetical protein
MIKHVSAAGRQAPENFEDAVDIVKQVQRRDPIQSSRAKAEVARDMATDRIVALNSAGNVVLQTVVPFSVTGRTYNSPIVSPRELVYRREELNKRGELYGTALAQAAWEIQAGYCEEHAATMAALLSPSGIGATIVRTDAPHAFPVVNMLPGADPDNPWTWGKDAFVPDSWIGATLTPEQAWESSMHFNFGKDHASGGKVDKKKGVVGTDRARLELLVKTGRKAIEANCTEYKRLLKRYMLIPQKYRDILALNPPADICSDKDAWKNIAGRWRHPNGSELLVEEQNGAFSGKYVKIGPKWRVVGLPDNAICFLDAKLKPNQGAALESKQGYCYAQTDCMSKLGPYRTATITIVLDEITDKLKVDKFGPQYWADCSWAVDHPYHEIFELTRVTE